MPADGAPNDPTLRRLYVAAAVGLVLVVVLFVGVRSLRDDAGWPGSGSDNLLLTGILVLGALPLVIVVLDVVIRARGSFKTKLFELDLSSDGATRATLSVRVPPNLGAGTNSIHDTGSISILAELQRSTAEAVALIDLGDGTKWWESRLFILAAGAARRGRPEAFVFVADDPEKGTLLGWATPTVVATQMMRSGRPRSEVYHQSHAHAARAADAWARQYATMPGSQNVPQEIQDLGAPWNQPFIGAPGGHLNPHAFEQMLASDLGNTIELPWLPGVPDPSPPVTVTASYLADLLGDDLVHAPLERDAPSDVVLRAYLASTASWFVITEAGRFHHALPRGVVQDAVVQALARTFQDQPPP